MKKIILSALIISTCLFSGCIKNYKTVSEYSNAMDEVKNKLGDYTIEATLSNGSQEKAIKSYTKTNNRWKTEISDDNGNSYKTGILYDGVDILTYDTTQNMAMPLPFVSEFSEKKMKGNKTANSIMKMMNPVGLLFNWSLKELDADIDNEWKFGKITKINKIQCRMIKSLTVDQNEVCVSDKYGIPVYAKFYDKKKNQTIVINVKSINNEAIDDSKVELPQGIKKVTLEDMLRDITRAMQMNN